MKLLYKTLIFLLGIVSFPLVVIALPQLEKKITLDYLASQISQEQYPALALFKIWDSSIEIADQSKELSCTPLDLLNSVKICSQEQFAYQFIKLCHQLGIRTRLSSKQNAFAFDFGYDDEWIFIDLEKKQVYLTLDNQTLASSEDLMDDPFLALRSKDSIYDTDVDFEKSIIKLAQFSITEPFLVEQESGLYGQIFDTESGFNPFNIDEVDLKDPVPGDIQVGNQSQVFDFTSPCFYLMNLGEVPAGKIWWQISPNPTFNFIPSNFEQIEPFKTEVILSPTTETFFNAGSIYYFRIKGFSDGKWGAWSRIFAFTVEKPDPVALVEFEKKGQLFELSWERESIDDPTIEYLVFGSNSLDFIPTLYTNLQINAMEDGKITDIEINNNLVAIIKETKILVDGSLAYYRIIARKNGQYSVPSSLIHVYDEELIQPRNVLQVVEQEEGKHIIKRMLLPLSYPYFQSFLPQISNSYDTFDNSLIKLYKIYHRTPVLPLIEIKAYQKSSYVPDQIWEHVRPYLLPENHPVKPKLDRMFSATRVILTPETFKKAGFKRYQQGRASRIMASPHPDLPHHFIKAFPDSDLVVRAEWHKFVHRIEGAKVIRNWITNNNLQATFSVPKKWIYPLPEYPSPPNSSRYMRKNFILVAENMRILSHEKNEKAYKHRMTRKLLDQIYQVFDDLGLYDSVYAFNVPFCKNGKLAFIDTEHHHRWPVPFQKLKKYFSNDMQNYWQQLIDKGGPKGHIRNPNY
ncbi:hypothetical protein [Candidatus Protochlamydia sp. W-9]|uniref:hypothetical protein n=1 Tax=Candidatus Protochlamydia sp. W-9 TaxID=1785087 RepID=UPI00096A32DA|nr:hypothetical protein [Candidatus Protochlamydia sp. W-9]